MDSRGRDTAALVGQDVASGGQTTIAEDPRADIGDTLSDPKTGVVQAWSVDYLRTEWQSSDPAIKSELAWLESELKGDINVTSRTDADDKWTVTVDPVTEPASTWLNDRAGKKLTKLFIGRPELVGAPLVRMFPETIKSRDGMTLVCYLTLPAGSDPDGDGKPTQPVPLVLFVHGGPWARDSYGYNPWHQWLANRGYAVLSVNYRGSTGFGKKFIYARQSRVGPQDARRPDRRGRLGGGAGHHGEGEGRDLRRLLRRLRHAGRPDLHARPVSLRRRHRRAVEPVHAAGDDPAVLGGREAAVLPADGQPDDRGGEGIAPRAVASVPGGQDQGAAAHRPGRQRSAGEASASRSRSSTP